LVAGNLVVVINDRGRINAFRVTPLAGHAKPADKPAAPNSPPAAPSTPPPAAEPGKPAGTPAPPNTGTTGP
jgi:hypothetical protein